MLYKFFKMKLNFSHSQKMQTKVRKRYYLSLVRCAKINRVWSDEQR